MADSKVVKVDDLSVDDRRMIVAALEASRASYVRAQKAMLNKAPAASEAFAVQADRCDILIARFR